MFGMLEWIEKRARQSSKTGFLSQHPGLRSFGKTSLLQLKHQAALRQQKKCIRTKDEICSYLKRYQVKRFAVLLDQTSQYLRLSDHVPFEPVDYYTFDLRTVGDKIGNKIVKAIGEKMSFDDMDGWLVMSLNPMTGYMLNHFLFNHQKESQIVVRLSMAKTVAYYSYVDFFSGSVATQIYIHHYLNRLYDITFPIDLRYCIKTLQGEQVASGQWMIPPDGTKTINGNNFQLGDFQGYIEIEFELESITTPIKPFFHMWVDYVSADSIATNHQSGFGTFGHDVCFIRGYIPDTQKDLRLVASVFNFRCAKKVQPTAILEYTQANKRMSIERPLQTIRRGEMILADINELFSDVLTNGASAIRLLIKSKESIHRPNYYHQEKGKAGWVDTYHATGKTYAGEKSGNPFKPANTIGKVYTAAELKRLSAARLHPWQLSYPIFPAAMEIESILGHQAECDYPINDFKLTFFNQEGQIIHEAEERFDYEEKVFFNVNEWMREKHIPLHEGMLMVTPAPGVQLIPYQFAMMAALKHKRNPYLTTTAIGAGLQNVPFYLDPLKPRSIQYTNCFLQTTDVFGRGVYDQKHDTLFVVIHASAQQGYHRTIYCEIDVYTEKGDRFVARRSIRPQTVMMFWLSDLIRELSISQTRGAYAVWVRSNDAFLQGFHVIKRQSDHSISIEHMFGGSIPTPGRQSGILN
ncbi:MAG: hypothetical protein COV74_09655 [Candidatus Omnitrophica bacterium CG11_big_fil_rev_8_21_14_0_20_45_26]|uniref:Uncharacterized protein n=1 Tax=Candidatus Abzuiibacterium crystallinum TaxID=1974748 RepID=A0A2H0LNH9_9BACT|nr:MAG: hypothetical protein COV74_09655 [Candidatus Omnitrophica bacterium CG11_big_fil_rev_8_21_14_0_20_45_26]PIW64473.1 MAG: hypothetical protein COW12_05780 [Candidatus Omnitrophica bacterium CG12_big_fil_rev_8_21_14_0_65_45_16]